MPLAAALLLLFGPAADLPVMRHNWWRLLDLSAPARDELLTLAMQRMPAARAAMPDYTCDVKVERRRRAAFSPVWRTIDRLEATLGHSSAEVSFAHWKRDGAPPDPAEMTRSDLIWTEDEFRAAAELLFHPQSKARFLAGAEETLAGREVRRYAFAVPEEASGWQLQPRRGRFAPAFDGTLWLDRESGLLLKLEASASDLPDGLEWTTASFSVEYAWRNLGGRGLLLPSAAELSLCNPRTYCLSNRTTFTGYRIGNSLRNSASAGLRPYSHSSNDSTDCATASESLTAGFGRCASQLPAIDVAGCSMLLQSKASSSSSYLLSWIRRSLP